MNEPITKDAPVMACDICTGLDFQFIQDTEEIDVGKETIPINVEYFKCLNCGEEFESYHPDYHPIADAYVEYKKRTGKEWKGRAT